MNDVNKIDSQSADNTQLVADLTAEVQRLKSQLDLQSDIRYLKKDTVLPTCKL